MLKKIFCLIIIALSISCNSKYPGYSHTWSGIYYKLISIGEDNIKPNPGDYITFDISYKTISDSVFFTGKRKFQLTEPDYKGSIDECFTMLSKGEKAEFIIGAKDFFAKTLQTSLPSFIKSEDDIKIEVNMNEIQSEVAYDNEKKAFFKWISDFGDYEKEILYQYMQENKMTLKPVGSGFYYLQVKKGNGRKIVKGDTLTIDYEGKFLNGKFFDSTIKRHEAFQFVYGTEWQVVKGMEEALGMMEEGEKALIILPSDMAFGQEGSSTGIVPPFTSLIYEIEIKKVN